MNVVAGPNAARFDADMDADPLSPTKAVSTKDKRGCEIHKPRHGSAKLR
jgi:hypothetical protein